MKKILMILLFSFALQAKSVSAQNNISTTPEEVNKKILSNPDFKVGSFLIEESTGPETANFYAAYWFNNAKIATKNLNYLTWNVTKHQYKLFQKEEGIKLNWFEKLVLKVSYWAFPKIRPYACNDGPFYKVFEKTWTGIREYDLYCGVNSPLKSWVFSNFPSLKDDNPVTFVVTSR